MREIPLTQGYSAIIDDVDFDDISQYKWAYAHGYAVRSVTLRGKQERIPMHVQIIGKVDGLEIDHINGDRLDNRRCNLRNVTHAQNSYNSASNIGTSRFKGVFRSKGTAKWRAVITVDGIRHSLGYFATEIDASLAYNAAATKYFGEYARLNPVCPCDAMQCP